MLSVFLNKQNEKIAQRAGASEKLETLIDQLTKIEGMADLDIDLDGLQQSCAVILPRFNDVWYKASPKYEEKQRTFLSEVIQVCADNGLVRTTDRPQSFGGGWFYIPVVCNWLKSAC